VILVVGAHSRNVGKTSLACAIIRATPQLQWTAIKISSNRSEPAHAPSWHCERAAGDPHDTGRFLSAGARSAWWLRAKDEQLPASVPRLLSIVQSAPNVLIESNRVVDFIQPDFYLIALDLTVEDFKDSARRLLLRADALVFVDRGYGKPSWASTLLPQSIGRPGFRVSPPAYESQDLTDEIRCRALTAERIREANLSPCPAQVFK
jgi:hypothetical protein